MLNKAEQQGCLHGIQFSLEGPAVHHLLFADDNLFLCKATVEQAQTLQSILKTYGDETGQRVNISKSSISFGANVDLLVQEMIKEIIGIQNEGGTGSYLGLPKCFSGSKVQMLDFIYDRLKSRLSGWFARTLSLGGKEVLLKAIALALPVYAMSCFK